MVVEVIALSTVSWPSKCYVTIGHQEVGLACLRQESTLNSAACELNEATSDTAFNFIRKLIF